MRATSSLESRFWNKVRVTPDPDQCWEWQAATRNGYGALGQRRGEPLVYAHRYSYESNGGFIPDGYDVCHKCHNRLCVNPMHLVAGTRAENIAQSKAAGRLQRRVS